MDPDFDACYLNIAERDKHVLLVNSPDLTRQTLVHQHRNFRKGPEFSRIKMLTGGGLIVSDGVQWRTSRRLVQPGFVRANWDIFESAADLHADRLSQNWLSAARANQTVDISQDCERYALDVMISALFSKDSARFETLTGSVFDGLKNGNTRDLDVVLSVRQARQTILDLITERQKQPVKRRDMLGLILTGRADKAPDFTDRQVVDELITLIVAGFETSAILMAWMCRALGDPSTRAYLREGNQNARIDSLSQECLRFYPPVWMFSRRATTDLMLGKIPISAGEVVAISPYLLHRRTTEWGDPQVFRPDRFAQMDKGDPAFHAYLPFSAGPRRCIGDVLSAYEMRAVFGRVAPKINFDSLGAQNVELDPQINLRSRRNLISRLSIEGDNDARNTHRSFDRATPQPSQLKCINCKRQACKNQLF